MKKSEIKIGKTYTDKKGNERTVLKFCDLGYGDHDCVKYQIVAKTLGPKPLGSVNGCTLVKFANWAKVQVE